MTLSDFILSGKARIAQARLECADPLLHMKQIAEAGLGLDSTGLYLRWDQALSEQDVRKLEAILTRRLTGEPFQYIVGYEWFWESKFRVGPGALIPRRETEVLVETLLRLVSGPKLKVAELGAGKWRRRGKQSRQIVSKSERGSQLDLSMGEGRKNKGDPHESTNCTILSWDTNLGSGRCAAVFGSDPQ